MIPVDYSLNSFTFYSMLLPIVCPKCYLPNEPARMLCWKCMYALKTPPTAHDYARLFSLPEKWTLDDLRPAYRQLVRKYHPDVNPNNHDAEALFKFVNQANEHLSRLGEAPPPPVKVRNLNKVEVESEDFDILASYIKKNTQTEKTPSNNIPTGRLDRFRSWIN